MATTASLAGLGLDSVLVLTRQSCLAGKGIDSRRMPVSSGHGSVGTLEGAERWRLRNSKTADADGSPDVTRCAASGLRFEPASALPSHTQAARTGCGWYANAADKHA